jgi:DNA-binding transcriptional MerR regulator
MDRDRYYSTDEVCKMLNVSKSTLFRWERDELIPPVKRGGPKNQREYTLKHLEKIIDIQEKKLGKQFESSDIITNKKELNELWQSVALRKYIAGDLTGIMELLSYPELSNKIIKALMQKIMNDYINEDKYNDKTLCAILTAITKNICKLCKKNEG